MPRVAALYRYPVKGFTPEPRSEPVVQHDGRVAGDRDANLLRVLTSRMGQEEPTLGTLLLPSDGGGTIRVGDEVTIGTTAR